MIDIVRCLSFVLATASYRANWTQWWVEYTKIKFWVFSRKL